MSLVADLRANPYFRLLISIVTAVSLTILVLSFTLYWGFDGILTTKTVTLVRANLNQLSESTSQTLASVEKTLVQAYFDDSLQRFGFNRPPEETDLNRGLDQLEKYRFVSSTIQSLYILNKATQTVYIASDTAPSKVQSYKDFFDASLLTAVKDYRGDRPFLPVARLLPSGREGVTLLFYDAVNPPAADSVLAANLDQSLFRDRLARMEEGALGTNLIVDGRGLVLTARAEDGPRWSRNLRILEARFQGTAEPGSEILSVDGSPCLVTWTIPDKNRWRSVSVVPLAALVAELDSLRGTMIVSALLVLFLGSLLATLAAWVLYRPIRERLDRVGQLEEQSREGRGALKERILRRILTEPEGGGLAAPEQQELSAFAIGLDPGAPCRVVLLRLDRYRTLTETLGALDLGLMKGALLGAARECLVAWGPVEAVEMEEEKLAVLLTAVADLGDEDLESALRGLQTRAGAWKVSVTCSWSDRGDNLGYASFLYRQALQNSFYRFFLGHGSLIPPSAAADHRRDDYAYPAAKEKQLIEALMLRNLEAAKACSLEILDYLSGYSQTTVNLGLSHLSLGLAMALDSLRAHWFSDVPFHFDTAVNLGDFETAAELNQHFFDLFEGVITLMNTRRHHKQNDLVTRVNELLEKEFANPNLSLDFLADRLGLTPTHVSKAYRKNCLKSIPDVILEYRIRRCRELLVKTDLTIAEVAEAAGFRNANYFHTLFRKVEGTTPAEFRKQKTFKTLSAPQS